MVQSLPEKKSQLCQKVPENYTTAKNLLKKACDSGSDPHLVILEFRNTPIQGIGLSPMQLLKGRCAKTLIPIKQSLLKQWHMMEKGFINC
jgi:hypothetical protein